MNYNGETIKGEEHASSCSMDNNPIITYAGEEALFLSIKHNLLESLKADTVEWRRSFGRPMKLVRLGATFIPFSSNTLPTTEKNFQLIKQPIFHIYWSECSDLDVYKSIVKDDIDSWLKTLRQHNINDWMIVLVETYDVKKTNKLIPRTTVLDKVRSDFATKLGDRCLSVINPIKSESRSAESWRGLISRIRHFMLTAYDKTLSRFEEIIRNQRERRNEVSWNFCRYFLLQEELAFVLEMLGIYDEALVQYDELDALFTQFILNSDIGETPAWLNTFQSPLNNWAGVNLKGNIDFHLRNSIAQCEISLLDFRSYLFGRQCAMLLLLKKPWEVAQRCLSFVYNTLSELKILEVLRPKGSIECWAVLCALEVLNICQMKISNNDNGYQLDLCAVHAAGLWALASHKLGELGTLCGLMPGNEPSSEQLHVVVYLIAGIGDSDTEAKGEMTPTGKLKGALSSKDAFKKQYLEYAELAMGTYKYVGRIRSARFIGKELAQFYGDLNENPTAVAFLLDALNTYIDEGWHKLAAQTRLELAQCYKRMDDIERYVKVCSTIASANVLHMTVRNTYFEEMLAYIKMLPSTETLITELEESFLLISVEVNVTDKVVQDQIVSIDIELKSLLPRSVKCTRAIISTEEIQRVTKRKGGKSQSEPQINLLSKWTLDDVERNNSSLIQIPIYSHLGFNENKSLKSAGIIDRNGEQLLKRSESTKSRRAPIIVKENTTETNNLTCETFTLQPGINKFTVANCVNQPNYYKVNHLALIIEDKLEFRSKIIKPQLCYEINHTEPSVSIISRDFIAGIVQDAELIVSSGSVKISDGTKLKLSATRGMTFKLADSTNDMSGELEISLPACESFATIKWKLKVLAELPPKKDSSPIEHKLNIRSPWGIDESIALHFSTPLMSCITLHTAKQRKFLQIIVTGLTVQLLQLIDPELTTSSSVDVSLKNLNPVAGQRLVIGNGIKVSFMWEMELGRDEQSMPPLKMDFRVKYSAIKSNDDSDESAIDDDPLEINKLEILEKSSYTYRCSFEVTNYVTMFTVISKVEAGGNGGEFCRAGSMCQLCLTVLRMVPNTNSNPAPQLMYEVLADQSMWAVCGRTAGIITLDTVDQQTVTLDVMPLTNGYLPLPVVRLSRYIPAIETKNDKSRNTEIAGGPRLKPFSPGQVYNASKAQQVHVLPAATSESTQ
ncbi:hypothetical protein PV327_002518 [Microctonus hyperodae]|uniref:Trafficking protein particle complex subunit 10 n=1 Tax=Microctonus hyperodae TaxID=165561 RepID=A0AA39FFW3_MICHY|nr:hypothetical protein PV327_002518 [Microctonus hyperodae]